MSPSGVVISRPVKPLPAPVVLVWTRFAPKIRSVELVVVAEPLLLLALLPELAAVTSTGLLGSAPLYSIMRMSDRKSTRLNSSHLGHLVCRLLLEKKNHQRDEIHPAGLGDIHHVLVRPDCTQ